MSTTQKGDRLMQLKAFDDTKTGVKGLLDSGIQTVPSIFIRPPEDISEDLKQPHVTSLSFQVPTIDLGLLQEGHKRKKVVDEVKEASGKWGFFQVVNHGVPVGVLDRVIDGVRLFNEQNNKEKEKYYSRDYNRQVKFNSNFDLFESRFANWRDTLSVTSLRFGCVDPDQLPPICRDQIMEYIKHIIPLGERVLELLSEALGLGPDHLRSLGCLGGYSLVGHYYPACPSPELTLGVNRHSDPGALTLLLQNHIPGLQVLHQGHWVNVHPIPGAIVVNIGDLLQIMSNDKLISGEHRVIANRDGPRISVPLFFSGSISSSCKPIEELTSEDNPPRYREIVLSEYVSRFYSNRLDGKSNLDYYKLVN